MNGRGEVGSPDPLDSFPRLRVRESDGASRRSSFGGDSELERYCSANSVMGTPSTSMSMCSAITVFHDFSDIDFGSSRSLDDRFENFSSVGGITTETNRDDRKLLTQRNLRYGSSGLELYGDCGDELSMTALDSSESIVFNRTEDSDGNNENGGGGEVGETEEKEEEEEFSEGEDSMFNYGSDGENESEFYSSRGENGNEFYSLKGENGNEFYSSRSVLYREEPEVRNENPLFMNSSVAFGSHDLDDFLLQNGPVSVASELFHNPRQTNNRVENDGLSSGHEKDMVNVNEEAEETKDIGDTEATEEVRDRDIPTDKLIGCSKTSYVSEAGEGDLGVLPEEDPQKSLNVTNGGSEERGNQCNSSDEAGATGDDARWVNSELDNSEFKFDHFSGSRVDQSSSNPSVHVRNMNAKSLENLEQIVLPSNSGMRKTLESSSTSTNLLEESPVTSKVSNGSHCLSSYHFKYD